MKKKSIVIIAAVLMMACVCCLGACTRNNDKVTYFTYADADKYSANVNEYMDYVSEVNVNWISGSVTVTTGNVRAVTIEETYSKDKVSDDYKVHSYLENGKLNIAFAKSGKFVGSINLKKDLTVTFPQEMDLKTVVVRSVSAKVELKNSVTVTDFRAETVSADVKAAFSVNSPVNFKVKTVSGFVEGTFLSSAAPFVNIETVSGKAQIDALDLTDVDFSSVAGDLTVFIPDGVGYKATLDSVAGKVNSEFDGKTVYGDGRVKIDAKTTTGNVEIKIKK